MSSFKKVCLSFIFSEWRCTWWCVCSVSLYQNSETIWFFDLCQMWLSNLLQPFHVWLPCSPLCTLNTNSVHWLVILLSGYCGILSVEEKSFNIAYIMARYEHLCWLYTPLIWGTHWLVFCFFRHFIIQLVTIMHIMGTKQ